MNTTRNWIIIVVIATVVGFFVGYYFHSMKAEKPHPPDGSITDQTVELDTIVQFPKVVLSDTLGGIYLPIYGLEHEGYNEEIHFYVRVPEHLPLIEKVAFLAKQISRFRYSSVEVLSLDERNGNRIARINLKGARWVTSWFQGSSGGRATTITLRKSFLQPEYTGEWIDGVQFYYEGEPIGSEWDHIDLDGVILREGS